MNASKEGLFKPIPIRTTGVTYPLTSSVNASMLNYNRASQLLTTFGNPINTFQLPTSSQSNNCHRSSITGADNMQHLSLVKGMNEVCNPMGIISTLGGYSGANCAFYLQGNTALSAPNQMMQVPTQLVISQCPPENSYDRDIPSQMEANHDFNPKTHVNTSQMEANQGFDPKTLMNTLGKQRPSAKWAIDWVKNGGGTGRAKSLTYSCKRFSTVPIDDGVDSCGGRKSAMSREGKHSTLKKNGQEMALIRKGEQLRPDCYREYDQVDNPQSEDTNFV